MRKIINIKSMPKPFLYACAVRFIHEKALHHDWRHRRERENVTDGCLSKQTGLHVQTRDPKFRRVTTAALWHSAVSFGSGTLLLIMFNLQYLFSFTVVRVGWSGLKGHMATSFFFISDWAHHSEFECMANWFLFQFYTIFTDVSCGEARISAFCSCTLKIY